jgi:hypothetical protein
MGSMSDEELVARIESARFTPEVDAFPESLAGPAEAGSTGVPPATAADQVVQEQRGFLARLFGR